MKRGPVHLQQETQYDCGPTCARMVLADRRKIVKIDSDRETGTFITQIGLELLKHTLVTYVFYHPKVREAHDREMCDAMQTVDRIASNSRDDILFKEYLHRFVAAGGTAIVKIPTIRLIEDALLSNRRVITLVTSPMDGDLRSPAGSDMDSHFVVVARSVDDRFEIYDPAHGEPYMISKERFLYNMYTNAQYQEIGGGTMLIVG